MFFGQKTMIFGQIFGYLPKPRLFTEASVIYWSLCICWILEIFAEGDLAEASAEY